MTSLQIVPHNLILMSLNSLLQPLETRMENVRDIVVGAFHERCGIRGILHIISHGSMLARLTFLLFNGNFMSI